MRTRTMVRKFCEGCIKGIAYGFMVGMGLIKVYGVSFAFWHLITDAFR